MITEVNSKVIAQALQLSERSVQRKAARESWPFVEQNGLGGKARYYKLNALPKEAQVSVSLYLIQSGQLQISSPDNSDGKESHKAISNYDPQTLWSWYDSRPDSIKEEGKRRAAVCLKVRSLIDSGVKVRPALTEVAKHEGVAMATLKRWWYGDSLIMGAANVDKSDYAAALAPRYSGCQDYADFTQEAWDFIKADWLRPERPSISAVYRRAKSVAEQQGWSIPSQATVTRRLEALPWQVRVLARDGEEALKRMLPHVTRVKGGLHALQAVNADGHVFDVRVKLPSGESGRPVLVAWQDIYSGKILSYRVGETLNQHIVRLAFGDLVENYGVPDHVFLDNGREFANKWMTGGAKTRFRFKIKEDDPIGIFTQLGIETHWTTPYHGQSKPIERAFRDLCEGIAKHPGCSGAYTGNSPVNKPANYGERVMEWEEFLAVVTEGIAEHNARVGRRSETARGRSFDETFAESFSASTIRKATAEQRRLWLLAAEGVTVIKSGHVKIMDNFYWSEAAASLIGKKVIVRFDSDNLTAPVYIYDLAGEFLGEAHCTQANFMDAQAAKDHSRANRQKVKAAKTMLEAERKMDAIEVAQRLPNVIQLEKPTPAIIQPMFQKQFKVSNGPDYYEQEVYRPDDAYILSELAKHRKIED